MAANVKIAPFLVLNDCPSQKEIWEVLSNYLEKFLANNRLSIFCSGPVLEKWFRQYPKDSLWIREKIKEGRLEFLGGAYEDILPPFFHQHILDLQIKKHQDILKTKLAFQPSGYFNTSMTWEIGFLPQLSQAHFSYAMVEDIALANALESLTRISGWFSIENNGCLLRILPVDTVLSAAFEKQDLSVWNEEISYLPQNDKTWVVHMPIPVDSLESLSKFWEHCFNAFDSSIQTWTISHIIEQQHREGYVNLLSAVGQNLGLPLFATSCRGLLLRRPEINFLHKALLATLRRAEELLDKSQYEEIVEDLFPVMASKFYADLGNDEGIRSAALRFYAHAEILKVSNKIDSFLKQNSLRAEVTDYLLAGEQQVWIENQSMSMLVEPASGAVLRSLNHKKTTHNFLNSFRDDGFVSLGFAEHILFPKFSSAESLDSMLQSRSCALLSSYDYRLERKPSEMFLKMTSEQVLSVDEKSFIFHLDKNFNLHSSKSNFDVSYKLTNMMMQPYSGYFGTEVEIGVLQTEYSSIFLKADHDRVKLSERKALILPNISELLYKETSCSSSLKFQFSDSVSCLIAPVYTQEKAKDSSVLQGFRLFFFKQINLLPMESLEFSIGVNLSRHIL